MPDWLFSVLVSTVMSFLESLASSIESSPASVVATLRGRAAKIATIPSFEALMSESSGPFAGPTSIADMFAAAVDDSRATQAPDGRVAHIEIGLPEQRPSQPPVADSFTAAPQTLEQAIASAYRAGLASAGYSASATPGARPSRPPPPRPPGTNA